MAPAAQDGFRVVDHPSDTGLEVAATDWAGLLGCAARGLMHVIVGGSEIQPRESRRVMIQAPDRESLLVRWLSELLYLYDAEHFLSATVRFEKAGDHEIIAVIVGEPIDPTRHTLQTDVKAVTYHRIAVESAAGRWSARVFLDI